jgi:hypothetical protein
LRYRLHRPGGGLNKRDPEPVSLAGVVDIDRGIVSREIFVDENYGQERIANTSTAARAPRLGPVPPDIS